MTPETVFTWGAPPVKFGAGASDELPHDLAQLGVERPLLVTDPGVAATGVPERLLRTLREAGMKAEAFDGAPGEVPGFQPLLRDLDLTGTVVTADALQTHRDAAELLVSSKQADYLFTVKANQPTLLDRCARLPWQHVPVLDRTRDRAHGRVELRTLKAVSVGGFGFPHTAQVLQVTRRIRDLRSRRWRTVTVYAVTSLPHAQASPARLADLLRGHWAIEVCQADCACGM